MNLYRDTRLALGIGTSLVAGPLVITSVVCAATIVTGWIIVGGVIVGVAADKLKRGPQLVTASDPAVAL